MFLLVKKGLYIFFLIKRCILMDSIDEFLSEFPMSLDLGQTVFVS